MNKVYELEWTRLAIFDKNKYGEIQLRNHIVAYDYSLRFLMPTCSPQLKVSTASETMN